MHQMHVKIILNTMFWRLCNIKHIEPSKQHAYEFGLGSVEWIRTELERLCDTKAYNFRKWQSSNRWLSSIQHMWYMTNACITKLNWNRWYYLLNVDGRTGKAHLSQHFCILKWRDFRLSDTCVDRIDAACKGLHHSHQLSRQFSTNEGILGPR